MVEPLLARLDALVAPGADFDVVLEAGVAGRPAPLRAVPSKD